ncbi:toxin YdaT family protein [Buttiauxella selenatireducens]|uniref:Toxin YdaT family protein n=1 Tax=Buttiauxella selenatireducens TaxID=3073902 RepID=A0ABY9SDF7_9ENTR|nr:toxin YdaT family protein [Buttiauxella sp. R73]WMY75388.1 toxin YdaT family protein [Buttiauxella sp. R73]
MQTIAFQNDSSHTAERLIYRNQPKANASHEEISVAVRSWAADAGQLVVAIEIQLEYEALGLTGLDIADEPEVWKVKLFRWLDNKRGSAGYQQNIELLAPAILGALPLEYRGKLKPQDNIMTRLAALEKEVSEAKQVVMLGAPKHQKLKELSEGIVEMFRIDPDLTGPLMAMVTTMLGMV